MTTWRKCGFWGAIAPKSGPLTIALRSGALTLAALAMTAHPGWPLPGQTVNLTESWIRNNPTLKPGPNERLAINRLVAPGQRFTFQASVFPISGVAPDQNPRQIRSERFSLSDHANPITVERLDESLRAIYGQEIFNDYRQATVLLRYPARGMRPTPTDNPNLVLRGEVREGERFAYWQEIAYDRAGTAYLGRMAVFVKDDLPALQTQLAP
ncbi:hypothetical protein VB780_10105 [Leptolyngbya sp. CCNP1308]|uniref:hypothetical protein n=1 Tax=Leptolyngbya sp. CCNP1308 TaxID=3110255 RepID=UPI002B1F1B9D|nr:hypothetical protein [Leptolyngbya sp. CCNP1308]MEA5448921.1 hypothetical protein [Leptolyngbya sp. CCNP1308]